MWLLVVGESRELRIHCSNSIGFSLEAENVCILKLALSSNNRWFATNLSGHR